MDTEQMAVETAYDSIVSTWGQPDTDKHHELKELADRALRGLELLETSKHLGWIADDGAATNPKFILLLAEIGVDLFGGERVFWPHKQPDYLKSNVDKWGAPQRWGGSRECTLARLAWLMDVPASALLGPPPS